MATAQEIKAARCLKANDMADLYRQGSTLKAIGEAYGCSRQYVWQLFQEIGVKQREGGYWKGVDMERAGPGTKSPRIEFFGRRKVQRTTPTAAARFASNPFGI